MENERQRELTTGSNSHDRQQELTTGSNSHDRPQELTTGSNEHEVPQARTPPRTQRPARPNPAPAPGMATRHVVQAIPARLS